MQKTGTLDSVNRSQYPMRTQTMIRRFWRSIPQARAPARSRFRACAAVALIAGPAIPAWADMVSWPELPREIRAQISKTEPEADLERLLMDQSLSKFHPSIVKMIRQTRHQGWFRKTHDCEERKLEVLIRYVERMLSKKDISAWESASLGASFRAIGHVGGPSQIPYLTQSVLPRARIMKIGDYPQVDATRGMDAVITAAVGEARSKRWWRDILE